MSRLRRLVVSDRWFFVICRVLPERGPLSDPEFTCLAQVIRERRQEHGFLLGAWVFLPDHWHCICAPAYAVTISLVMKSVKESSTAAVNQRRGTAGELWQPRFFDRALSVGRRIKEYNEKVEYIHNNPVNAGLVSRSEDWRWSSYKEYAGMSADEQKKRCGLIVDRVRMPSNPRARI